jgi:arginine exporter protein ArgO
MAEQQSPLTQSAYYGNDYTAAVVAAAAASQRTAAAAFAFLDNYGITTAAAAAAAPAAVQSADATTAATDASEYSRVSVAVLNPKVVTVGELYGHFSALTQEVIGLQSVHRSF